MFNLDGRRYISGWPGPRGWYANVLRKPELILHLKTSIQVNCPRTPGRSLTPANAESSSNGSAASSATPKR
jgi:hypothetical protein